VAPDWKLFPTRSVIETELPALPSSGIILLNDGLPAVVVVTVVVAVVFATVAVFVVTVAVTTVGADVGIDETVTWVIFTLYTFSITFRAAVSVDEDIRYPQVPSVFL